MMPKTSAMISGTNLTTMSWYLPNLVALSHSGMASTLNT